MKKSMILGTLTAAAFVGLIVGTAGRSAAPRADNASPTFRNALTADQQQELTRGAQYLTHDDYADAAPILGKYALMGQPAAQSIVGAMYYFGKGFPVDRDEGLKWMRLSAAQNYKGAELALAEADSGTLTWSLALSQPYNPEGGPYSSASYSSSAPAAYADGSATSADQTIAAQSGGLYGQGDTPTASPSTSSLYDRPSSPPTIGAESYEPSRSSLYARSTYDSEPAPNVGAINVETERYMAPAGPGAYVDPHNGTYYAPSGQNGVVNTRTGEYSPVSH